MRTSTKAVPSCKTVSMACVCRLSMLKAPRASSRSTTTTSGGSTATAPSSAWICQSSASAAGARALCQRRTTCATANAISRTIMMRMTSARISGVVSCRKKLFTTLSALSMDCCATGSGVQVRNQQALHARDLVLEKELTFFQTLHLDLIHVHIEREARNDLIQIAVLDAQLPQLLEVAEQLAVDVVLDLRHGLMRSRCTA